MNHCIRLCCTLPLLAVLLVTSALPTAHAANPPQPIAAPQDVPDNVVANGGFEQQLDGWQICGGVGVADAQADAPHTPLRVHRGRYAARLGNPTLPIGQGDKGCPDIDFFLTQPHQLLRVPVQIPADADVMTVSFWYSRFGPENTGDIPVYFSDDLSFVLDFPGELLDPLKPEEGVGWHEFRQVLRGDELRRARMTRADFDAGRPASGNTYLNIRLQKPFTAEQEINLFIDDVAVTFSDRSLQSQPLPAALQGDGTQPIVYMHPLAGEQRLVVHRMDTDGQHAQPIYRTRLQSVTEPRWSPDGQRLVVIEKDVQGVTLNDPTVNPALVDELTVLDPNGMPLSTPGRTLGKPGVAGSPPGCVPGNGQVCTRPEQIALDNEIYNAEWSPQSDALLIESGFHSRSSTGATGDDIAALMLVTNQTDWTISGIDDSRMINNGGTEPSWGANNLVLFRDIASGIYQDTPEIKLDNAQLLLPNPGGVLSSRQDTAPSWSRDGTQFVTMRGVAGGSTFFGNKAIVLHDPANSDNDHTLVVVDYPATITDTPTWSPDGKYVLFTVQTRTPDTNDLALNIWWVEVATGNAGQITTDGTSFQPDWRPTTGNGVPAGQAPGGGTGVQVAKGFPASSPAPLPQTRRVFLPLLAQH